MNVDDETLGALTLQLQLLRAELSAAVKTEADLRRPEVIALSVRLDEVVVRIQSLLLEGEIIRKRDRF